MFFQKLLIDGMLMISTESSNVVEFFLKQKSWLFLILSTSTTTTQRKWKKRKEKRLEEILRESESYKYSNKPMIWKFQTCFIFLIAEVSEPVQETCFTASVACKKQGQTGEKIKFNKREVYPVF